MAVLLGRHRLAPSREPRVPHPPQPRAGPPGLGRLLRDPSDPFPGDVLPLTSCKEALLRPSFSLLGTWIGRLGPRFSEHRVLTGAALSAVRPGTQDPTGVPHPGSPAARSFPVPQSREHP